MGIYAVKPRFQQSLRPVKDFFVRHRIHPTMINVLGLAASIITAGAILLSQQSYWFLLAVPFATTFRTACNALDGLVSRELGVASALGEVLNELIDRISDSIIFFSVIYLPSTNNTLGFMALIIVLLNSYLGILSKSAGGSRQYGGLIGKADRMILISVAAVLIVITQELQIWNGFLWFIVIGTLITFVQRFMITKRELQRPHARQS